MTQIEIPLTIGDNYISFPATSTNTINDILTSSGIKANISKFIKWDSIQQKEVPVATDDTEYIEEGRGYYLYITSPGTIIYDGTEYSITYDQFISHIVQGWNLLGIGKDTIVPQTWCKIIDPITSLPITILQSGHSYWVNYSDCIQPTSASIGSTSFEAIFIIGTILMTYYYIRELGIIGKPTSTTYKKS
jgi:hypothetical protein